MAPELLRAAMQQASQQEAALVRSVSSDVYSLGATLWATLSGRSPLEFRNAQVAVDSRSSNLPAELLKICQKSMSENPALRHQSAQEFADELAQWLNRPRWNQYFPGLRNLLWMIVAPCLLISNLIVWTLMREQAAGGFRTSLRCSEGIDVSKVAALFGGGGHRLASGCTVQGATPDDALQQVLNALAGAGVN